MITGYNKSGDFFTLLRACLLVGYVEFARNIRLKWKGYFVACEQALCLGKNRLKACSQAKFLGELVFLWGEMKKELQTPAWEARAWSNLSYLTYLFG